MAPLLTNSTIDSRSAAKSVIRLLDHWKLSPEDKLSLLGISAENATDLVRYRSEPLSLAPDVQDRAGNLLGIHRDLRLLFPHDRELAYAWMTQRNRAFDGSSPVEYIRARGLDGLLAVRAYLDRLVT